MPVVISIAEKTSMLFRTRASVQTYLRENGGTSVLMVDENDTMYMSYSDGKGAFDLLRLSNTMGGDSPNLPLRLAPEGSFLVVTASR